jgi:alpha-L-arabinofuranosidase
VIDATARKSKDGKTLVLQVVNATDKAADAQLQIAGFAPSDKIAHVTELSGPLSAVNAAAQPKAIAPVERAWMHRASEGPSRYTFPPRSLTVIEWK